MTQGHEMRRLKVSSSVYPTALFGHRALLAEALIAATCHQTNWDRLRRHILGVASAKQFDFRPSTISLLTFGEWTELFGAAYSGDDLAGRYALFTDTADCVEQGRLPVEQWLAGSVSLGGEDGLFRQLARCSAFAEDPQEKKSRIFAQQLIRNHLVEVIDPENLPPAIEYHLIRLYLRTGRIQPLTDAARNSVRSDLTLRVDSLNVLREAVEEAMRVTAEAAEMELHDLNDAEWQIARAFCVREEARCAGPALDGKPCDSGLLVNEDACPLAGACEARATGKLDWSEPKLAERYSFY